MSNPEHGVVIDVQRVLILTALLTTIAALFYSATVRHVHEHLFAGIGRAYSQVHGHLPPSVNDPTEEEQR
jgi:hypothetical protein